MVLAIVFTVYATLKMSMMMMMIKTTGLCGWSKYVPSISKVTDGRKIWSYNAEWVS